MLNRKILVTGGLGYIGSHTVVELQNEGFDVVVIDDLSNSSIAVLDGIEAITGKQPIFEQFDLRDKQKVQDFFKNHNNIDGVIHFAASKAVGESVVKPLLYYENNVVTLIYLLQELEKKNKSHFIFSSSRTVYGRLDDKPMSENLSLKSAESPYGNTKKIGEDILKDTCMAKQNLSVVSLRYFNPIGAHSSSMIGELPLGEPQNLVPYITQTAMGIHKELKVFGGDWPTKDGTCIRDYLHVVDLAKAHITALKRLLNGENESNFEYFNLGSGKGNTVLEVIDSFERVSGRKLKYQIVGRRSGDDAIAYADTNKANEVLGWKAESTLDEAIKSAWDWEQKIRN
ncbi:UDP-glucose 4-epimerase GalE [Muricauda sp. JGD-17]|uniref:UDP-glucose 4-epimerase n=1 Tax=Flagellimonas ochracea TaxID=2696472 RepID=A0A964TEV4_9FLAO|nr:UDP-glucose 4-epimerase GalE [Allomuricauda ochracea]NAY92733.1 UDP-glucose 4-epimerase GalE [Allomuricauda ochracea]